MLINHFNFTAQQGHQRSISDSLQQISTGARINRAADDSAGLSISSRFSSIHTSLLQSSRNIHDGIGLVQTIDSALEAQGNILVRMRELSVQASNEIYGQNDRQLIREEMVNLRREYERIANNTTFNNQNLLRSSDSFQIQIGEYNGSDYRLNIDLSSVYSGDDVTTLMGNMVRGQGIGFTSTSTNLENLTTYSDSHFLNELPGFLDNIDSLINRVSSRRTIIGAYQNRLEVALNNNHSYEMNLMAANSQISDANYAKQTSALVGHQVRMQASVSSLSQARGLSSSLLSLL